ncbi:MAG: glycerate kinase [Lachnospiraceae bacterium]|nr:glycerate kinase [Lachnospiraceae bacterium]
MGRKVFIIPDSFKGSMSSPVVAGIIGQAARRAGFETIEVPVADGGEGTCDCVLAITGGEKRETDVVGPEGNEIRAAYGITRDGCAVIELAESSGITKQNGLHPMTAGTYGFGQLIKDALDRGVRKFLLGLGGSASTDCGMGMAAALGVRFIDKNGESFIPCGERMRDIDSIDMSGLDPRVKESSFRIMSDVTNPLSGPEGAAYIYGPQKGADREQVRILDEGLRHAGICIERATGCASEKVRGAGAAGGSGYGCAAFLNAKPESGIEVMLDLCEFDKRAGECELIVTGEGSLDRQSLMGKVLSGIKAHAGGIPVVSFCGRCGLSGDELRKENITAVVIGRGIPVEESVRNGEKYLRRAAEEYFMGLC